MIVLPDIRQRADWDCGKAIVVSVLSYFGSTADLRRLGTNPMDGTDPRSIEAVLRMAGHRVVSGEMDMEDLKWFTKRGMPVIAVVNGHFVAVARVFRGMVSYQCPINGPQKCKEKDFLGWWIESDRLGVTYQHFGIAVG